MPRSSAAWVCAFRRRRLLFVGLLTLFPTPRGRPRPPDPLVCIFCGDFGGVDFLLNILLFVPLGLGLALAGFSWRRAVLLAGLLSFGVELLQMKIIVGRDASLGDVMTNTTGGGVGALLGSIGAGSYLQPPPVPARLLALV